ncbi:nose resistant to fluoxetine protein 6-like [Euwallacea similis]|uniref:nose resistant to fluoxetine protein 6-like n=1 Tax=Euwallacea similis TaxID=1736056 RepID=UPI003450EC49
MKLLLAIASFSWLCNLGQCDSRFALERIYKQGFNFNEVIEKICTKNTNITISKECLDQICYLCKEQKQDFYKMMDSWSIFPYSGAFYYASKSDWGNYDECIEVSARSNTDEIYGKFCAWGWTLPISEKNDSVYLLAYCVPQKCQASDLNTLLLTELNITAKLFNDFSCSTKKTDREIDTGAIVALVIFISLFAVTILSTAYDVYLYYTEQKSPSPLFTAFSMFSNGKKLLQSSDYTKAGDQILCFHGMKFISMWWIISGHGFISWFLAPVMDTDYRANWQTQRYAQYIASAHISVDTFFYISGFLMAYLYFKQELSKKSVVQQVIAVPMMIVHRYLRLTPANAMCFVGAVYLFKYLQNGPFFSYGVHTGLIDPCKKYWWTYFLYIQNYYNFHYDESLCIPTTWYLSADMQLFLITPLILIPISIIYKRSFMRTMLVLLMVNIVSLVIPIWTKLEWRNYDPTFKEYDFHSKLISYFIGVMMGIYMRHQKSKRFIIPNMVNLSLWFLALGTMLAVIFYRQDAQIKNEYVGISLCYSFTRPMWCCALAWITFACVKGYGGPVNWFLSSPFMQVGGKLTYCLYIVHGMVIAHFSLGVRNRLYFSDWHSFYQNCGYFIVSMLVATFWSLSYEAPMIILEKIIFGHGKPKPVKSSNS